MIMYATKKSLWRNSIFSMNMILRVIAIRVVYLFLVFLFPAVVGAAEPIRNDHYVIIRIANVTPNFHGFVHSGGGVTSAMEPKTTSSGQVYDVIVWQERQAVHAYAFSEKFNPYITQEGMSQEEWVEHRESFVFRSYAGMPESSMVEARSRFLRDSLSSLFEDIYLQHPDSGILLMFSGHGGGGGGMIEGLLNQQDSFIMLNNWVRTAGRKIDCIDFGGPCDKASLPDLVNFAPFCSYYIASDLPNGGYSLDNWNIEDFTATDENSQYPILLNGDESLENILRKRIDITQMRYELSSSNMIANKVEQANYLFDCEAIQEFVEAYTLDAVYSSGEDLLTKLVEGGMTDLIMLYNDMIVHSAHNRDFFNWEVEANGVYTYGQNYQKLSLDITGGGQTLTPPGDLVVIKNTNIPLVAASSNTANFKGWLSTTTGGSPFYLSTAEDYSLAMDQNYTIEAVFAPYEFIATSLQASIEAGLFIMQLGAEYGPQILLECSFDMTPGSWKEVHGWKIISDSTISVPFLSDHDRVFYRFKTHQQL